ncbi:MAG: 6-bladed beta-propeller, partial [Gemmatimonadota bacterium]
MKRLLSLLAVTFATTLSLGCTGESATHAQTATRSDSAGIEIVTSTVPAWTTETAWRLSAAPVLDIGTLDGPDENQLFRVLMARRSTDGRIYVANTGTHEIRVFDSGGEHLRSFGREGDGPGEFRHPVR